MSRWISEYRPKQMMPGTGWLAMFEDEETPNGIAYSPIVCFCLCEVSEIRFDDRNTVTDRETSESLHLVGYVTSFDIGPIVEASDASNFIGYCHESEKDAMREAYFHLKEKGFV